LIWLVVNQAILAGREFITDCEKLSGEKGPLKVKKTYFQSDRPGENLLQTVKNYQGKKDL